MSARGELLADAAALVDGDRNAQYGDPNQDFRRTGILWSTYLHGVLERKAAAAGREIPPEIEDLLYTLVDPWDVGWMQILLKSSRSTVSPHKRDHYADTAGYSACGWDCARSDEPVLDRLVAEMTKPLDRHHRSTVRPPAP